MNLKEVEDFYHVYLLTIFSNDCDVREFLQRTFGMYYMSGMFSDGLTKRGARCKKHKGGPLFSVLKKVAEAIFSI